jgi:hypothetical protein
MSELREDVADRLERAADRMYNSGLGDEERRYREAAAAVRAGLTLEETLAIEQSMLGCRRPGARNRLTALAAQGEYDGGDAGDQATAGSALGDALAEPVLTDIDSGASQLLSTAPSDGLSDPYDMVLGGWALGPQPIDPYTALAVGIGSLSAYVGQAVDWFTGVTPVDDNPNSYTNVQNVDPNSGAQNADSFGGGQSTPPSTASLWNEFGYSGPAPPGVASPDLLALNPANANSVSDAVPNYSTVSTGGAAGPSGNTAFVPNVSDTASDTGGSSYVGTFTENGVTYYQFADVSGFVYEVQADDATGPNAAPSGVTAPGGPGTATSVVSAPTAPATATPGPSPTDQNTSPAPDPGAAPPTEPQPPAPVSPPPDPPAMPPAPAQAQPGDPAGGTPAPDNPQQGGQSATQIDEANWDAAKAGMWDGVVGLAQGLVTLSLATNPAFVPLALSGLLPSLDFAKAGPPALTGDPVRDSELLDNYHSGGLVTTTISLASPIGAEGILDSAVLSFSGSVEAEIPGITSALSDSIGTGIGDAVPTGPSFEGVIDPAEFENDPVIVDRLGRAQEFDIGGYRSLTGRGEFGRVGDNLDSDEALQNAFIRMEKGVDRVSEATKDNPAMALSPTLHRLIDNLTTADMQGMNAEQVLEYHLEQMRDFVPEYIVNMLEREAQQFISRTF